MDAATVTASIPLVLGSGSPRRRAFVEELGITHRVHVVPVDETVLAGEAASVYLARVVADKLAATCAALRDGVDISQETRVLVADTTVIVSGDRLLGKPADAAENAAMIRQLAGSAHTVATRFAIAAVTGRVDHVETVKTRVFVRPMTDAQIAAYAATGEGFDKAGGYAIQGLFARYVRAIEGSYATVVGLPLSEVAEAFERLGLL
jgi:septum formation protein